MANFVSLTSHIRLYVHTYLPSRRWYPARHGRHVAHLIVDRDIIFVSTLRVDFNPRVDVMEGGHRLEELSQGRRAVRRLAFERQCRR
jgi:hypothetical protein